MILFTAILFIFTLLSIGIAEFLLATGDPILCIIFVLSLFCGIQLAVNKIEKGNDD